MLSTLKQYIQDKRQEANLRRWLDQARKIGSVEERIKYLTDKVNEVKHPFLYSLRAESFAQIGDFQRAIEDYTCAIDLNPASEQDISNRGHCRMFIGDCQGAIDDFNTCIEFGGADIALNYSYRAQAEFKMGDLNTAQTTFEKALKECGKSPHTTALVLINRAEMFIDAGLFDEAVSDATKAIELSKGYRDASYFVRAQAWAQKNEFKNAINDLKASSDHGLEDIQEEIEGLETFDSLIKTPEYREFLKAL